MFFKELDLGFSDLSTIVEKESRYKNKPDAKTARVLASYYNTQGEMKKAAFLYEDAAKFDPDNDYELELFQIYYSGMRRKVYSLDEVQSMAEKAMILDSVAEISNLLGDPQESVKLIEQALKEDPESEFYQKQLERFKNLVKI